MLKKIDYILCAFLVFFTVSQSFAQTSYKQAIDSVLKANHVIGLAYTVVSGEKELDAGVWGVKRFMDTELVHLSDLFHIGANTKAFTAFLAARMVEEGKVKWDTKFFTIFPELKANAKESYHNITLQDLLSHRAYLPPFTSPSEYEKLPVSTGSVREQRVAFASYALQLEPVKFPQGQPFAYSSAGYILAASMLEKIANISWEEQAIELFNIQMGLNIDFGFPNRLNKNQPWGHLSEGTKHIPTPPEHSYKLLAITAPAGDIAIPIQSYGKWLRHQLLGFKGKDTYLKEEMYNFMHFGLPQYSLAWFNLIKDENSHISWHDGSAGTFFCDARLNKEKNIAVAIFSNSADPRTVAAIGEVRKILLRHFQK